MRVRNVDILCMVCANCAQYLHACAVSTGLNRPVQPFREVFPNIVSLCLQHVQSVYNMCMLYSTFAQWLQTILG